MLNPAKRKGKNREVLGDKAGFLFSSYESQPGAANGQYCWGAFQGSSKALDG